LTVTFSQEPKSEEETKSIIWRRTPFQSVVLATRKHIVCPKAGVFLKRGPWKQKLLVIITNLSQQRNHSQNNA